MIMIIYLNEQYVWMIKFFVDKNSNRKKHRDGNTINKPSMIDMSFENPHKFTDLFFLESEKLVRY